MRESRLWFMGLVCMVQLPHTVVKNFEEEEEESYFKNNITVRGKNGTR